MTSVRPSRPPWHWRWFILPLRENVWYPFKRWWHGMGPRPGSRGLQTGGLYDRIGEAYGGSVREFIAHSRAAGQDALGVANDPEWPKPPKLDLRYDPLAIDEEFCGAWRGGPVGIIDCQETYDERTGNLMQNLRIGAGLCLADMLAHRRGMDEGLILGYSVEYPDPDPWFEPGRPYGKCVPAEFYSGGCVLGTKSCQVDHVCDPETGELRSRAELCAQGESSALRRPLSPSHGDTRPDPDDPAEGKP